MKNDPATAERILALLRRYGWEMGMKKLEDEISSTQDGEAKESLRFFAGWMAAERGQHQQAHAIFQESQSVPALEAWSRLGRAFVAMRQNEYQRAFDLLSEAKNLADPSDQELEGAIAHLYGALHYRVGKSDKALVSLRKALAVFKRDHFATGRVLDTFGLVYAGKDNFHGAEECYREAIRCKTEWDDQPGLAVSLGNLGRLYLDWGDLDHAEECFHRNRSISQKTLDERGETMMQNHLGQVELERGLRFRDSGRPDDAHSRFEAAAAWIDSCISRAAANKWTVTEAYARKDRARLDLAEGRLDEADGQLDISEKLFLSNEFEEGCAHVNRARGILHRLRREFEESKKALLQANLHFEKIEERAEQARTMWEYARSARAAAAPRPEVTRDYRDALAMAEASRRGDLVRGIGAELKRHDADAYYAHAFRRVRGRSIPDDIDSLTTGTSETVSVMFLDLKDSTPFGLETAPEVVMTTLNQMMAEMVDTLRHHTGIVTGFRGDGFMALFRGPDHARRAVEAGLDLCAVMTDFNEPRRIIGREELRIRVGISTGGVVLGNMGTYDLIDFTAIGTTANRGARLEAGGEPGRPCIDFTTYDIVRDRFRYAPGNPREVDLKGLGVQQVWDVVGRAASKVSSG